MKLQMGAGSILDFGSDIDIDTDQFDIFKSIESKIYTYFNIYLQSSIFFIFLKWRDRQ